MENCFEVTTTLIKLKENLDAFVACIYRPPNSDMELFLVKYTEFVNKFKGKIMYICGDFNIDLIKNKSHASTSRFLDLLYSFNFYPLIIKPTRITEQSATLIDNIFTNDVCNEMNNYILIDDTTDHLPVLSVMANDITRKGVEQSIFKRNLSKKNIEKLKIQLEKVTWDKVFEQKSADKCYDNFLNEFVSILDECCKVTKSNTGVKTNKPWLTQGLINACKKRITCINVGS